MTDTNQLHQDFLRDFTKLLEKYKAEYELIEDIPEVFFHYILDEDVNVIRECSTFTMPDYINPN